MSKNHILKNCRTADDFIKFAKHNDLQVLEGTRHTKIYTDEGYMITIPRHNGDLCPGTRHSILKWFIAIGFSLTFISCGLLNWIMR